MDTRTRLIAAADILVKAALFILLLVAVIDPAAVNLDGKAPIARATVYPLGALVVPAIWWLWFRDRKFPWTGDLLISLPWLTDLLGNVLDLFDSIVWFDDWIHFGNWFLLTAGLLLLTLPATSGVIATYERALALGVPMAVGWELGEYVTFVATHQEYATAYTDTLGDLGMGSLGALLAATVVYLARRRVRQGQ